eukprot:11501081-Prorocentrum_lima.AAC.1
MTSSLVGSEMCIRDRILRQSSLVGAKNEDDDAAAERCPCHGVRQSVRPVSYTHLTLPTICSV